MEAVKVTTADLVNGAAEKSAALLASEDWSGANRIVHPDAIPGAMRV